MAYSLTRRFRDHPIKWDWDGAPGNTPTLALASNSTKSLCLMIPWVDSSFINSSDTCKSTRWYTVYQSLSRQRLIWVAGVSSVLPQLWQIATATTNVYFLDATTSNGVSGDKKVTTINMIPSPPSKKSLSTRTSTWNNSWIKVCKYTLSIEYCPLFTRFQLKLQHIHCYRTA
jgi:hypothetical protein